MGVVKKTGEEGRQGVVGDAEAGGDDIEVHDELGDEEGGGCSIETPCAGEDVAEDAGEAGSEDVIRGELLVLVGGGHQHGAGGPERIEDNDDEKDGEQGTAGWDVA